MYNTIWCCVISFLVFLPVLIFHFVRRCLWIYGMDVRVGVCVCCMSYKNEYIEMKHNCRVFAIASVSKCERQFEIFRWIYRIGFFLSKCSLLYAVYFLHKNIIAVQNTAYLRTFSFSPANFHSFLILFNVYYETSVCLSVLFAPVFSYFCCFLWIFSHCFRSYYFFSFIFIHQTDFDLRFGLRTHFLHHET